MVVSKVERFVLFALGTCYHEVSKRLEGKPLSLSISKAEFIGIVKKMKFTKKGERAMYKNLESLESKKLVRYGEKNLALSKQGQKLFDQIHAEVIPYLNIKDIVQSEDLLKYARKAQTVFSTDKIMDLLVKKTLEGRL